MNQLNVQDTRMLTGQEILMIESPHQATYTYCQEHAPVSWRSKNQSCITLSIAKAEYMSLTSAAQEAICLDCLLVELQKELITPAIIHEDNQSDICMTKNPTFHG